ncbi:SDR family NAD(P)-dependent oxidoreductase [Nocardioides ginsengisoli]|uniref:SDR family NAD(P)-dependent oxidoreductase n=1 Tax=Nocardioides ginsengisoli TaxID=363868 RepID=A0ABW3W711_9ACTN
MVHGVALVTGAASGIGEGIAASLVRDGWTVRIADLSDRVKEVADRLGVQGTQLDVRDDRAVAAWVNESPDATALVTSAGICAGEALVDSTDEDWQSVLDINFMGTVRALRAFSRNRIAAGGGGAAVLIASNNAFWPARTIGPYCASKAAVLMLGRTSASELGEHQIRVNVVAPGETDTPMTHEALQDPAELNEIVRRTPLGRIGHPEDIADAVALLLQPGARWITGQLISVDGGISLRGESDLNPVHQDAS